jgi:uncharacterized protein YuzE
MSVTIAGITFDRVTYYADGDVLYLHVGDPSTAVEFDGVPEGDHIRYDADGELVGITLLSPRWRLQHDGEIVLTLPERQVRITDVDLHEALAAA